MKNKNIMIIGEESYFREKLHSYVESNSVRHNVFKVARNDNLFDMIQRAQPSIVFIEERFYFEGTPFFILQCLEKHKCLNIVVWSVEELTTAYAGRFINLGARSFIDFRKPIEETREAILSILKGDDCVSDEIREASASYAPLRFTSFKLTVDEVILIRLLVYGKSPLDIGKMLHLTEQTVRFYLSRIYAKCAVSSREQLVLFALETNIVTAQEICSARMPDIERLLKECGTVSKQKTKKAVNRNDN
jgi:DNA-binding NarL/FixJ family response regulator